jgi:hypothetical protein
MRWEPDVRVSYLALYNLGIAAVCTGALAFAVQADHRAHAHADATARASHLQKLTDSAAARDQLAVDRYNALTAQFAKLVKTVNTNQRTLAAEIAKTRTMKRKVVTGSTVVSYVTVNGRSPSG